MGREKDETQEQYLKRCKQAERERKILSYAPYFWLALFLLFFLVWPLVDGEPPAEPGRWQ